MGKVGVKSINMGKTWHQWLIKMGKIWGQWSTDRTEQQAMGYDWWCRDLGPQSTDNIRSTDNIPEKQIHRYMVSGPGPRSLHHQDGIIL